MSLGEKNIILDMNATNRVKIMSMAKKLSHKKINNNKENKREVIAMMLTKMKLKTSWYSSSKRLCPYLPVLLYFKSYRRR